MVNVILNRRYLYSCSFNRVLNAYVSKSFKINIACAIDSV